MIKLVKKLSITGLRGTIENNENKNDSLFIEDILNFSRAFGTWLVNEYETPTIAVARDGRSSAVAFYNAVIAGLLSTGCKIVLLDLIPIPTLQLFTAVEDEIKGAIMVTASHNPPQYNGLKFLNAEGQLLSKIQIEKINEIHDKREFINISFEKIKYPKEPKIDPVRLNIHRILKNFDLKIVQDRHFKIALDPGNSTGIALAQLLEVLNCQIQLIHEKLDGNLERDPEPKAENLSELQKLIQNGDFDLGLATDSDADRLALLDEQGNQLSEERLFLFSILSLIQASSNPSGYIITSLSFTHALEDFLAELRLDLKVERVPTGERNLIEKIIQLGKDNVFLAGDEHGGVIFPKLNLARDALAATAVILQLIAKRSKKISEINKIIPTRKKISANLEYNSSQQNIIIEIFKNISKAGISLLGKNLKREESPLNVSLDFLDDNRLVIKLSNNQEILNLEKVISDLSYFKNSLKEEIESIKLARINFDDGLKIEFEKTWVMLRVSMTEPKLKFIVESIR